MKLALCFAFILASASSFAQQAPRAMVRDQVPREAQVPGEAVERPAKAAPRAPAAGNAELSELLRAQTAAIKSLSSKIDQLEERVSRLEGGRR